MKPLPNLPPDIYRQIRVSPNGSRFATSAGGDIRLYDFAGEHLTSLTTDPAHDGHPLWAPNGLRVFFTSSRAGYPQIFSRSADGTGSDELVLSRVRDLTNLMASAWADDRRLVFSEVPNDLQVRLGQVDTESGDVTMLMRGGRATISRYGIAYEANVAGRFEIYVERFPALGNREPVAVGRDPRWSRDGRELFFVSEDGRQILSAKVQSGPVPKLGRPEVVNASAGMIPVQAGDSGYDVTRNGFVVIRNEGTDPRDEPATLKLVQNWGEELKQRVPGN